MRFQLADELRQVLQAAPKTIELVNCDNVDATFPDFGHHRIQAFTAESRSARFIQILDDFRPWPAPTNVGANLAQLTSVILRVSRDTPINCNAFWFHGG